MISLVPFAPALGVSGFAFPGVAEARLSEAVQDDAIDAEPACQEKSFITLTTSRLGIVHSTGHYIPYTCQRTRTCRYSIRESKLNAQKHLLTAHESVYL